MMIEKRGGFTLVELLVVIAVIALLMAILMPALQLVRDQTKSLICQSNLRQWGVLFMMYADDHEGKFMRGHDGPGDANDEWIPAMERYVRGEKELYFCPLATRQSKSPLAYGNVFVAWGYADTDLTDGVTPIRGSYGINEWIQNSAADLLMGNVSTTNSWRTYAVKGAGRVPLLLDAWRKHGTVHYGEGPPEGEFSFDRGNQISGFCVNRHRGAVNGLFLDFSVRKVQLKELWKLKWYRTYNTNGPWTIAGHGGDRENCAKLWDQYAPWMRNMPEF